ncbi:MAG: hypothetical protein R3E50_14415 [Halioglobus sp.]
MDSGAEPAARRHCALLLPLDALLPAEVLDIRMDHMAPVSPLLLEGTNDGQGSLSRHGENRLPAGENQELPEIRRIARLPKDRRDSTMTARQNPP